MNNVGEKYLKALSKSLKVETKIKEKIIKDIRYDMETKIVEGEQLENILAELGDAKQLAYEFNQSYPEYKKKRKLNMVRKLVLMVILIAIICGGIGVIGEYAFLHGQNVVTEVGVDGPKEIIITSRPISVLTIFDFLVRISVLFMILAIGGWGYFLVLKRRKGEYI